MTILKKTFFTAAFLFCGVICAQAALAAGPGISFSYAFGAESSKIYELNLQYIFNPLLKGESLSLSPLVGAGGFCWDNSNDTMWGGHASLGFNLDAKTSGNISPCLTVTFGPGRISHQFFDDRNMGGKTQFRSSASLGLKFGNKVSHRLGFSFTHYSNARIYKRNPGFNGYGLTYSMSF